MDTHNEPYNLVYEKHVQSLNSNDYSSGLKYSPELTNRKLNA